MKGKEALKIIKDSKSISFCEAYAEPLNAIEKDLDRLEKLELALEKACERLEYYTENCPFGQGLIYETNCELNCKDTYKKCWKKYFMKEVLGNE